jgi:hypothetical protein
LFCGNGYAVSTKAAFSTQNGVKASRLIDHIVPIMLQMPVGQPLVLLNPKTSHPQYSVFLMDGFNVLNYGTNILRQKSLRQDIPIWILDENVAQYVPPPNALIVTIGGDTLRIVKQVTWKDDAN